MDRTTRLESCSKCTKRDFSPQLGIVCSLTGQHANFEGYCPDFQEDEKEARHQKMKAEEQKNQALHEDSLGLSSYGIKNLIVAGVIVIIFALTWFFVGLFSFDRIFFYPPILFVLGLVTLVKGINQNKRRMHKDENILDEDL